MQEQTQIDQVVNQNEEVQQAEQTVAKETVEQSAARYLMMAIPMFRAKQERLWEKNKTEVGRVLSALTEAPLEKETRTFTTTEGQDLFLLGLQIMNSKLILFNAQLKIEETKEENKENENGTNQEV